jgi:hypothetical protein
MTLILELSDNKEAALKAKARAQGVSAEQYAEQVLDHDLAEAAGAEAEAAPGRHISDVIADLMRDVPAEELATMPVDDRPVSEMIREIWADMPEEVRAKLPVDGASEHDHYIYGLPKRNP